MPCSGDESTDSARQPEDQGQAEAVTLDFGQSALGLTDLNCGTGLGSEGHRNRAGPVEGRALLLAWKAAPSLGRDTAQANGRARPSRATAPPRELMKRVGRCQPGRQLAYLVIGEMLKSTVIELLGPEWSWTGPARLRFGSGRLLAILVEARLAEFTALTSTRRRSLGHRRDSAPDCRCEGQQRKSSARLSR